MKENLQIDLLIDSDPLSQHDDKKWLAFVEKYLIYGLEKKGIKVNLITSLPQLSEWVIIENSNLIYLPVFTENSSGTFLDHVRDFYESRRSSALIKMGLLKESAVLDICTGLFPDHKLMKMYLIDIDNGLEIGDVDLWKKENFNLLLFKIADLCNELEIDLKSKQPSLLTREIKAVYLAETTPDLISVREEIRRELLRQGFEVYPKMHLKGNLKDMEKTIMELLQKSSLSIHLFGKLYQEATTGEAPMAELENKLAANFYISKKESKKINHIPFRRIIWLPDNLIVTNEKQIKLLEGLQKDKKLYAGSDIIKSSVEELKDIILEKLTEKLQKMAGIMIVQKKLASLKNCLRTD